MNSGLKLIGAAEARGGHECLEGTKKNHFFLIYTVLKEVLLGVD